MRHVLSNLCYLALAARSSLPLLFFFFLSRLLNLLPISLSPLSISLDAVPLPVSHRKSHMPELSHSGSHAGTANGTQADAIYLCAAAFRGSPPTPRELDNIVTVLTELLQSHTPASLWWTHYADWALAFLVFELWGV